MIHYHKIDLYITHSPDGIRHYVCLAGGPVIATAYSHSEACQAAEMYRACSPWPVEIHAEASQQELQARRRHLSPSYARVSQ